MQEKIEKYTDSFSRHPRIDISLAGEVFETIDGALKGHHHVFEEWVIELHNDMVQIEHGG